MGPTVKNEGNTEIIIGLEASNMTGVVHGKKLEDFDAQFKDLTQGGEHIYFQGYEYVEFGPWLELCRTEKLDFSVHADAFDPADMYVGTMTVFATPSYE